VIGRLVALLFICVSLANPSLLLGQDAAAPKLTLGFSANSSIDGQIEAGVRFDSAVQIGAVQLDLVFDPKQVRFEEVSAGADLKSALIESRLKKDGVLAVALISNAGASGEGELLKLVFSVIGQEPSADDFAIENALGWTLDTGAEVTVTLDKASTKKSEVKEPQSSMEPIVQIEYRLPPWAYAVGGAGAATIFFLFVMLVRSERKTR
jgi:Cohesin domain